MTELFDISENDIFELEDKDFWEIQKYKSETIQIQWTPFYTGWVRARLDSIAEWGYMNCYDIRHAEQVGLHIINEQKTHRENPLVDDYDSAWEDNYYGA